MKDPWGREIFWIGGGAITLDGERRTPISARSQDGYVSVTPLHLDLTHHDMLEAAERWWRDL